MIKAIFRKHEMHMTRTVAMPFQFNEQFADRSIMRNRIRHRNNGLEPENPIAVAGHNGSLIRTVAAGVLHVVEALGVGLPDVDFDVGDRSARGIFDGTQNKAGLAVGIMGDLRPIGLWLRLVRVEGSQDGAFGAGGWFGMVDAVY